MWGKYDHICPIISITNAQNWRYWADKQLYKFMEAADDYGIDDRKKYLK
jgi:starch phosphorylase